jgi:hypothetical protein
MLYTGEGSTLNPYGDFMENFQILAFQEADSKEEALELALEENHWISDYDLSEIHFKVVLDCD